MQAVARADHPAWRDTSSRDSDRTIDLGRLARAVRRVTASHGFRAPGFHDGEPSAWRLWAARRAPQVGSALLPGSTSNVGGNDLSGVPVQ
jgi:hypothetical protein